MNCIDLHWHILGPFTLYTVFDKKGPLFVFFRTHSSDDNVNMKFLPVVAEEILN